MGGPGGSRVGVHSVHQAAVVLTWINTRPFRWVFYRTQDQVWVPGRAARVRRSGRPGGPAGYPAAASLLVHWQAETQPGRVTQTRSGQDSDSDSRQ